mmetsp:Transcript_100003/g.156347  ORF Transcript_100003/g.156347 Transcript_100003/m.156347 type:complete len:454 (+) Transcript_100003:1-1362(+)
MVLPPANFVIGRGVAFGDWVRRARETLAKSWSNSSIDHDEDGHLGCFSHSTVQRRLEDLSGSCGAGEIYCWLQCTSVANLPCGQDAQCIDAGTGKECVDHGQLCQPKCPVENVALEVSGAGESRVNGKYVARPPQGAHSGSHRMDYKQMHGTAWLQWNSQSKEWILKDTEHKNANTLYWSSDDVDTPWTCSWRVAAGEQPLPIVEEASKTTSDNDGFCNGMGTDMFMGGFVSLFDEIRKSGPCLIIFFSGWKLDEAWKFIFALVGALLAGVACEALLALRGRVSSLRLFTGKANRRRALMVNVALYATHRTVGYLVMLLAMTYSVEMFVAVILGLSSGYFVFNASQPVAEGETACCSNNWPSVASDKLDDPQCSSTTFIVEGMTCGSCAESIQRSVERLPDVSRASVNLATGYLTVCFASLDDASRLNLSKVVCKAVEEVGFAAREDVSTLVF